MGFYAPAQLVNDARRNDIAFRPIDVQISDWDCTLERGADDKPEVRLGLRMVAGLPKSEGLALEEQGRASGAFLSVDDLAHRATLPQRSLSLLAQAGALESLAGHRRQAHWRAIGIEILPGALAGTSAPEPALLLPIPTESDDIVADYRSTGLTLGRHPLALFCAGDSNDCT
jgi:error-prone DNA polymerase